LILACLFLQQVSICMQFCSNALIPSDVGACGSLYYAWLGLPLLPCQKHIPDDHPHGFVISIMWTQMLAAYRLLRQKISNIVSHFTCYVCSLLYGAYQMMLTTAGTLCNVITDNQVRQAVVCTVTGAAQSHEQHSAPAFQQSLGVYLCMRSHARYERKSLSHPAVLTAHGQSSASHVSSSIICMVQESRTPLLQSTICHACHLPSGVYHMALTTMALCKVITDNQVSKLVPVQ